MAGADYGTRVWQGDQRTVDEAHERYLNDKQEGLIPYAVALYSFRRDANCAASLLALGNELGARAEEEMRSAAPFDPEDYVRIAETADTLSTHLEWISRQLRGVDVGGSHLAHETARELFKHGIYYAMHRNNPKVDHTIPLLYLTNAQIFLDIGDEITASSNISLATGASGEIPDPNQRTRVYRKIGMLYRRCRYYGRGIYWGVRAIFVRGVTMSVRLKSIAALLGVDA